MKALFVLTLLANFLMYAYGTGAFGPPPEDVGRERARVNQELRAEFLQARPAIPRAPESNAANGRG